MNRFTLSILSLAVAISVSACNKNANNPRTKPVPGPQVTEKKKPLRSDEDFDAPPKEKSKQHDAVVDPKPEEKKNIPPAPHQSPEYAGKAEGKPGYVSSPYDPQKRLIDVRGLPPGTEAECPYTHRTFLVPP